MKLILLIIFFSFAFCQTDTPFRYLAFNVGNAGLSCWESKLCDPTVVAHIRSYIDTYQPDIILVSEVYRASQLTGTDVGGPILPKGYNGIVDVSVIN